MSFHLHLRAVAELDICDDHGWLAAFMLAAWREIQTEFAAGIADAIEKDFDLVNDLYSTVRVIDNDSGGDWKLPIYGGRAVAQEENPDPPLMLLDPFDVKRTAQFLASISFDELWGIARGKVCSQAFYGWDEATVREIFLDHHTNLRSFYGRAASAGHAVVKAAWY